MGARILIAEDEAYIVESLKFLLSHAGHEVETVADGGAVLPAIQKRHPDLLILDVMLPTTNGYDVLRLVRGTKGFETLPVLVLTAKGQEADRRLMIDLGANDFVTKPFSNQDLIDRVNGLVSA